jgi:hypothetical protein
MAKYEVGQKFEHNLGMDTVEVIKVFQDNKRNQVLYFLTLRRYNGQLRRIEEMEQVYIEYILDKFYHPIEDEMTEANRFNIVIDI